MKPTQHEHLEELASFGTPPSFDIRMVPLPGVAAPAPGTIVILADTTPLRQAVRVFAEHFKRETSYDFVPFDVDDGDVHGVLFSSRKFRATFPIAAGAAGFTLDSDIWQMEWVWLHPYERNSSTFDDAWTELEDIYGSFHIVDPYSTAMEAFMNRRGIYPPRRSTPD